MLKKARFIGEIDQSMVQEGQTAYPEFRPPDPRRHFPVLQASKTRRRRSC